MAFISHNKVNVCFGPLVDHLYYLNPRFYLLQDTDYGNINIVHAPKRRKISSVNENTSLIKHLSFCLACKYGKMRQENFPSSQTKTSKPFELVHSDVWGPPHTLSVDGYRSYLNFIDDFTCFTWIFPLKLKSECLKVFFQFNTFVERQFNSKIECLQTDWGGEFRPFCLFFQV